jgi:hypothetical protein
MIRKMVVIAAAIAIPVSAITALGAVVGTGVAGAGGSNVTECVLSRGGAAGRRCGRVA